MSEGLKTLKLLFKSLFVLANVLIVVLFIASAYSDRVSPNTVLGFSYLGLAFPVLCLLNLCFVIYWLFLWEWRFILIGLGAFIICWGPVKKYFPYHSHTPEIPKENVIKVLTYNVMGFAYKDHTKDNPNKIIEYIANSGADIVCLQEYAASKSNKYLNAKTIYNALDMYPYRSVIPVSSSGYLDFGIAVYSKYPISNSRRIKYKSESNASSLHELNVNGKKLTLINNHLESFKLTMEDRSRYKAFIKNISTDTFDGIKGALEQKLGPAFKIRAKQAEAVAAEIEKVKDGYVLVCGDFNDTPISYAHRTVQGPLVDSFAESGRGMGVTYNQNMFLFRIDHILHSKNMKSMNCTVDKIRYSDHYPIWCYLSIEEN